jgi:hypothetical protein
VFSRLQPFVNLQAPILAWPTDCSDHQGTVSLRPPGRIHRAVPAPLPVTSSGIATCPNRTIDTTGLVRASALPHLLDRSLVGCSHTQNLSFSELRFRFRAYTLHLAALAYLPFQLSPSGHYASERLTRPYSGELPASAALSQLANIARLPAHHLSFGLHPCARL